MPDITLLEDRKCFGCGQENPIGLKLEFRKQGDEYVAEFTAREEYQGWSGIMHGGITATILDEGLGRLSWEEGYNAITAELTVRYKKPIYTGMKLRISACLTGEEGRRVYGAARATDEAGNVVAEATAIMVKV